MPAKERIKILDGFRFLAIVPVMLFHYYSRWTPPLNTENYYPYGDAGFNLFRHGNMGVSFFFIISGFVIFYTLDTCKNYTDFLLKRFIRLFPSMLLCSLITFFLVPLIDSKNVFPAFHSASALNFIPGFTFTTPGIWNVLLGTTKIGYVSGVYWSLWVEVYFYIIAGGLFFYQREKFIANWLWLSFIVLLITKASYILIHHQIITATRSGFYHLLQNILAVETEMHLPASGYNLYFSLGIFFYCLYRNIKPKTIDYIILLILYVQHWLIEDMAANFLLIVMIGLFLVFIYRRPSLSILENHFFAQIGIISYPLYLLHEGIGIILIGKLGHLLPSPAFSWLLPAPVMILLIAVAWAIYNLYEKPVIRLLRKKTTKQIPSG